VATPHPGVEQLGLFTEEFSEVMRSILRETSNSFRRIQSDCPRSTLAAPLAVTPLTREAEPAGRTNSVQRSLNTILQRYGGSLRWLAHVMTEGNSWSAAVAAAAFSAATVRLARRERGSLKSRSSPAKSLFRSACLIPREQRRSRRRSAWPHSVERQ
jgi:hypothetical protein